MVGDEIDAASIILVSIAPVTARWSTVISCVAVSVGLSVEVVAWSASFVSGPTMIVAIVGGSVSSRRTLVVGTASSDRWHGDCDSEPAGESANQCDEFRWHGAFLTLINTPEDFLERSRVFL